ncbi:hypothetical protein ACJIZ3_001693 [Penstemon smallii]|uniref:Myb/SANT-like domain-containing protein n=1 Tax=Penstemon smallii TaxID=265156 RepID=A0ABD3U5N5_9LAMI
MDSYMNFFASSQTASDNSTPEPTGLPSTNSSTRSTKLKNGESQVKATWDTRNTEVFITLCVGEMTAGNRPGSHFNRIGWENLVKKFAAITNRNYTKVQLKNKWDSLKKEWSQWKSLLRGETGLGWNQERGTVDATDEWWIRKIQANPEAAKFRDRGPIMLFDQEKLFNDVIANGAGSYTPSSGLLPPHMRDEYDEDAEAEPVINETTPNQTQNQHTSDPIDLTENGGGGGSSQKGKKKSAEQILANIRHKKVKKCSTAEKIARCLDKMVDTMENESTNRVSTDAARKLSIQSCLEILEKMDGIDEGDDLWLYSTRLFLKPAVRDLFLMIKKDESRLKWLQGQMRKDMQRRANSNPSVQSSKGGSRFDNDCASSG